VPPDAVGTWTVYRLDLATGEVKRSYASADFGALFAPTPDGDVLVIGGDNGGRERLFLLTGSDQLIPLAVPSDFQSEFGGYVAKPGVWMPLTTGVALYTKAYGARVMAQSPYGLTLFPAGACR
jgi:hypothetical protein